MYPSLVLIMNKTCRYFLQRSWIFQADVYSDLLVLFRPVTAISDSKKSKNLCGWVTLRPKYVKNLLLQQIVNCCARNYPDNTACNKHIPAKIVKFNKHKYRISKWIIGGLIASIKIRDKLGKRMKDNWSNRDL